MVKKAIYFEDLQKDRFVVHVSEGNDSYLEQRDWVSDDPAFVGEDAFMKYYTTVKSSVDKQVKLYAWLQEHSTVIATAVPTKKWMDREWISVPN